MTRTKLSHRREDLTDWVQAVVAMRAADLGLTAYAVTQAANRAAAERASVNKAKNPEAWTISEDAVRAYMAGRSSMGSHKLQHLLDALGLEIVVRHADLKSTGK